MMDRFLNNYKVALEKSRAYGLNFFKFGAPVYDVGTSKKDALSHGWPMPPNNTSVIMEIAWASSTVQCEVVLSDEDDIPDVIVTSEELRGFVPSIDYDAVSAAAASPSELLSLTLRELLQQLNAQVVASAVPSGSRLAEQLAGLIGSREFRDLHWEAFAPLPPPQQQQHPPQPQQLQPPGLSLQVTLPLDYGSLSSALLSRYPEEEMCAQLLMRFTDSALARRVPAELKLTPSLKNLLQDYQISVKFPDFDQQAGSLAAYFVRLLDNLQQRLQGISNSCGKREELINALLLRHQNALVEFDSENYLWISFIFEWHDFHFLLLVELPREFPHPSQPWCLTLRSLYHHRKTGARQPYEKRFESPPYSPRWTVTEMADRLEVFVLSMVGQFQRDSVSNS